MADTTRTKAALLALMADNSNGDISAQDMRDFIVSTFDSIDSTHTGETKAENLIMEGITGSGIRVDTTTPTWGWRDLEGVELVDVVGQNAATLSPYQGLNIREFSFSAGDLMDIRFHIPHDYVPNTDLYIHVHWSHNGTAISGAMECDFNFTYAKGHSQATFEVSKVAVTSHDTVDIATTPQYLHMIDEVQMSVAGGGVNLIDSSQIETDGLILVKFEVTGTPSISGGIVRPFVHRVDIHYQSSNMATKNKSPDFYVA